MTTTTPSTRSADPCSDPRMTEAKQTRQEVQTQERLEAFSSPLPHHYMLKCETLSLPRGNTMKMICHRNLIRFKLRLPFTFFSLALTPRRTPLPSLSVSAVVCLYAYTPIGQRRIAIYLVAHPMHWHLISCLLFLSGITRL